MVKECEDVAANDLGPVQCISECHKYSCFVDVNESKLMYDGGSIKRRPTRFGVIDSPHIISSGVDECFRRRVGILM